MPIKGFGCLIFIGIAVITLIVLIDESDAAKKAKSSSKKEKEQAEQSEIEGVEEPAEENVKSSKLYKKKKLQEKFSKKGKKYSKLNEGVVQDEPMKVKKLKKVKLSAHEVYEEEPIEKTVNEKIPNVIASKKVKINKIESEDPTVFKSKKQKKAKYVEEKILPAEEETPKIKIKKAKKMKATKVAEKEETNENIPTAQTDNTMKYVYIKLPLEELQHFKDYQQQKLQQQIVEQEKILESVVFEDVRPKKKQTPRVVRIPVSRKIEDQQVNKTLQEQLKEAVTEVKTSESSKQSEESNSASTEQIIQDADQTQSKGPMGIAPAEEESLADEETQAADEGPTN